MREGKLVERSIAKLTRPISHLDWEVVYRDPLIEGQKPEAKPIPALTIHGVPMWGAPDLVFRYRRTGGLVIVERKASDKRIPMDGWPDLRAQLWCYAQIDDPVWREAPTIRLVGEVWARSADGKLYLRESEGGLLPGRRMIPSSRSKTPLSSRSTSSAWRRNAIRVALAPAHQSKRSGQQQLEQ
jgi:hypothetical protein